MNFRRADTPNIHKRRRKKLRCKREYMNKREREKEKESK
jgi:hypothetical protein